MTTFHFRRAKKKPLQEGDSCGGGESSGSKRSKPSKLGAGWRARLALDLQSLHRGEGGRTNAGVSNARAFESKDRTRSKYQEVSVRRGADRKRRRQHAAARASTKEACWRSQRDRSSRA